MGRYTKSQEYYNRAKQLIPLGSQTYSKSILQYPYGVSPLCADRAQGAYLWDIDGNKYVDLVGSLWTVGLGYGDKDVIQAVETQLKLGSIFSLSHHVEYDVAQLIVDMVPCAQMLRFAKNGTDVTSAAIRLARAYTGREHVAICGYHGWQDWYISITNKKRGIPNCVTQLSHNFQYNNIESLRKIFDEYPGQVAAVILEPINLFFPQDNFLEKVKELCGHHKALLIFDEIVTGFRVAIGGAQQYFNVTPDLATFGKSVANGMPLSILAGRRDIMSLLDEVYFSGTFGGEALSLAAAKAVLQKIQSGSVLDAIHANGRKLAGLLTQLIIKYQLSDYLQLSGHEHWTHLIFKDIGDFSALMVKTFILKECFNLGLLTLGPNYINYSMTADDIDFIVAVYDQVLFSLVRKIKDCSLKNETKECMLKPVFSVR